MSPSATWYISGFRYDNVETKFDSEKIWDLLEISKIPEQSNIYPESSGLVISGLKLEDDSSYTTITFEEFTRVMNLMNFGYSGINGSGNMISSTRALDVKLNVVGRNSETFTLDYLLKNNYISFYYNNDSSSQLNSFNWDQVKDEKGNWLTSPGTLSNGDSVRIVYKDPTMSTSYEYYAYLPPSLEYCLKFIVVMFVIISLL